MKVEFNPHDVIWTPEKVGRFWNHFAYKKTSEQNAFSYLVGDAIINMALHHTNLKGNILDYGCAHGFLIEKLLSRGFNCEGLEFSADSARKVAEKFKDKTNFRGITLAQNLPIPLESDKYDFVFVLETIEHLLPQWLDQTLSELCRITKKGGMIFVSVPNEENLDAKKVICPECGGIFHTIQHISSWTKEKLIWQMSNAGFREILCKTTRLRERGRFSYIRYIVMLLAHKLTGRKMPHLIYIGEKPA